MAIFLRLCLMDAVERQTGRVWREMTCGKGLKGIVRLRKEDSGFDHARLCKGFKSSEVRRSFISAFYHNTFGARCHEKFPEHGVVSWVFSADDDLIGLLSSEDKPCLLLVGRRELQRSRS